MLNWSALSAIASILALAAIIVAWRQLKADHERSRRVLAVELIQFWSSELNRRASVTRKLAETLDVEESKRLSSQESFVVKRSAFGLLKGALPAEVSFDFDENHDTVRVPQEIAVLVRWEVVTYLNKLESVLTAWNHNIADKTMLEEQFEYLVSPQDGHTILERFRNAEGLKSYPAICNFVAAMQEKHRASEVPPGRGPVT